MIALTDRKDGKTVYVNPTLVRLLIEPEFGEGTDVVFDGAHRFTVNNNIDELMRELNKALRS